MAKRNKDMEKFIWTLKWVSNILVGKLHWNIEINGHFLPKLAMKFTKKGVRLRGKDGTRVKGQGKKKDGGARNETNEAYYYSSNFFVKNFFSVKIP